MATSAATHPLLMAATEPPRLEVTANATNNGIVTSGADQNRREPSKPRSRRTGKTHPPKKQPQRGMGVAQLERLRLQDQERWTKMSEIPPQPYTPPYFLPHNNPQRPGFPFPGPLDAVGGVPVQYRTPPTHLPPVSTGLGLGLGLGMGKGFLVERKDDGGVDHGRKAGVSVRARVMFDAFGAGAPVGQGGSSKAVETSRELSSIPNVQKCVSDRCDVCLKKKRMDSQSAGLFINRARENCPEKMGVSDCDFLGLNLEIPPSKAARTPIYTAHNLGDDDQNVEVTGIRRRVNVWGGGVSMEYEFFPGKSGRSAWTEGLNFPAGGEVAADADASGDGGGEASNSIDLSLKLSC